MKMSSCLGFAGAVAGGLLLTFGAEVGFTAVVFSLSVAPPSSVPSPSFSEAGGAGEVAGAAGSDCSFSSLAVPLELRAACSVFFEGAERGVGAFEDSLSRLDALVVDLSFEGPASDGPFSPLGAFLAAFSALVGFRVGFSALQG